MAASDTWLNCYGDGWKDLIVPPAFAHPAKFSRALIQRIYQHVLAEGWIKPGDVVVDPFAGVALGALDAQFAGLTWIGVELEQKFVDLGQQNLDLWQRRYSSYPKWGRATILQGDSRQFASIVQQAGLGVSSPPYEGKDDKGSATAQERDHRRLQKIMPERVGNFDTCYKGDGGYGSDPRNLGNLSVSSPPFGEGETRDRSPVQPGMIADCITRAYTQDRQGTTSGNLATLSASSPPFEDSVTCQDPNYVTGRRNGGGPLHGDYGEAPGNIGNQQGETFWTAARTIVEQLYLVLAPGAHAIWVVKAFVRNKEIVDFPGQWRALCEQVGFVTLHEHHASLVEDRGTQLDLDGNHVSKRTERKSFFRRLAESKGSPRVDYETVLCMERRDHGQSASRPS